MPLSSDPQAVPAEQRLRAGTGSGWVSQIQAGGQGTEIFQPPISSRIRDKIKRNVDK